MSAPIFAIERPATGAAQGLVFLLHGVGANERSLAPLAAQLDPRLHVVLPRAPLQFAADGFGWFPVRFGAQGPVIDPQLAESSRRLLLEVVAHWQQRLQLTPAQTLLAGFSQGGIMSASVALTAPALVQQFAILSGRILPEIAPLVAPDIGTRPMQALVMHGYHDSKLPFALAEAASTRLAALDVAHELRGYEEDHALSPAMARDFCAWTQARLLSSD